jgi:hypothetical protein
MVVMETLKCLAAFPFDVKLDTLPEGFAWWNTVMPIGPVLAATCSNTSEGAAVSEGAAGSEGAAVNEINRGWKRCEGSPAVKCL